MSQTYERTPEAGTAPRARFNAWSIFTNISLEMWAFYFVAKLALFWKELIGFHTLANLGFAAFVLFPVKRPLWRRMKQGVAVLLGVALLYYDSWLPPIGRVLSQSSLVSGFSFTYLIELAGRFISLPVVAMLVAAWGAYWLVSRWVRLDAAVIAVIAAAPGMAHYKDLWPHTVEQTPQFAHFEEAEQRESPAQPVPMPLARSATPAQSGPQAQQTQPARGELPAGNDVAGKNPNMDKVLQDFLAQEATRSISFPAPKNGAIPFDIIFIHVCSLSWDDVRLVGLEHHPLWQRFDILLTRFNTATPYSGPAAIRMLRATCGQPSHPALYSAAADKCYLMESLKRSGFEPGLAMNHDGHFDNFLQVIQTQGRLNVHPLSLDGVTVSQHAFDGSPVYDDLSVLTRWLESRQKSNIRRTALFYNTTTLHDGNHLTGADSRLNSRENYKIRLAKFLDELDAFFGTIEKSGMRAVIAMIPEHGAALRGDKMQIAGLREIPSPAITLVPVGVKVIGPDLQRAGRTTQIDKPTSYLAVSHLVARLLDKPPFANKTFAPSDYSAGLPVTPFVSQNEETVMVGYRQRYYLRQDASGWLDYTDF